MNAFICTTCGMQYSPSQAPPKICPICEDDRQFVNAAGQGWTTHDKLALTHTNSWRQYTADILGVATQPRFAIGQRALLLRTPHGNVLWDCISLLDAATITVINALGGIQAMAISHPHFYTAMVAWSEAFNVPVHVHADDRDWIMRSGGDIKLWDGDALELVPDVTVIRGGGHFPGSSMLHWGKGANGRGVVCASDTAFVAADRKHVSFMRSYPNLVPLPARAVEAIAAALAPFEFDMLFGNFYESVIATDAKAAVDKSVKRYLDAIAPGA
jgi:glyoxylase-like metal-dependent hydrolase (beta-lactamase superfamily II)